MALAVGTQDKKKVYIAAGLGALALLLVVRTLFIFFGGPSAPPAQTAQPIATAPTPAAAPSGAATPSAHEAVKLPSGSSLDPTLRPEVMAQAEDTAYTGNGRNIFSPNSAAPVPDREAGGVSPPRSGGAAAAAATAGHRSEVLWLLVQQWGPSKDLPAAQRRHLHRERGRCG